MPTTDAAIDEMRRGVQELQDQITAAERETSRLLQEKENDSTAEVLTQEKARLAALLASKHLEVEALGGDPSKIEVVTTVVPQATVPEVAAAPVTPKAAPAKASATKTGGEV